MEIVSNISECSLFKGMSEESLIDLLDQTNYSTKQKDKGDFIVQKNSYQSSLIILLKGVVSGETTDENGKIFHLTEHKAPIALATALLFGKDLAYPIDVIAKTDCQIMQIDRKEVMRLMQGNDIFFNNYMQEVADRSYFLHNKITCFSMRTLKEKLLVYLFSLSKDQQSDTVVIGKSQNELAHYFGVNRPSLTREIRNLHNNGFIIAEGKEIKIIKRKELHKMVSCDSNTCINSLRR